MSSFDIPNWDVLVLVCPSCRLRQFAGTTNLCRRCRKPLPITLIGFAPASLTADLRSLSSVIGDTIRELRLRRGYSQSALARRIGSHRTHVSRIEHAQVTPTIAFLVRAAVALGVEKVLLRIRK
jgi:ribosome-binding protein aMBF1 (putative translation factor)